MKDENYVKNLLGALGTNIASGIESEVAALGSRSLSHESALVAIRNHPDNGIDVLSKVLGLTHSGTVRLINTLEGEGLVERKRSGDDARAVVLRVTPKGRSRANTVLQAREHVTAHIFQSLNEKQKKAIVPALESMLSAMTQDISGARRICRLCDESICRAVGCPVEGAVVQNESNQ